MCKNIQTREKSTKTHIQHFVTGTLIFNGYFNSFPEVLYSGRASNKTITINGIYVNRNGKQWDDLWTTKSVISQDSNNTGNSRRSKISGDILKSETMPICTVSRSFWSINHIYRSFSNVESQYKCISKVYPCSIMKMYILHIPGPWELAKIGRMTYYMA